MLLPLPGAGVEVEPTTTETLLPIGLELSSKVQSEKEYDFEMISEAFHHFEGFRQPLA